MSLIPELLNRKSLIHQSLFPGFFSPQAGPASTPASSAAAAPVAAPARRSGLRGALGQIFAGQDDPRLSDEENKEARKMALIRGGLATMAASQQPGATALGAAAQGAMFGQQTGDEQREFIYGRTQAERVRNALKDPAILAKLTPEQRSVVGLLPPSEATKVITEALFRERSPVVVGGGSALVSPTGEKLYEQPAEAELPSDLRGIAALMPNATDEELLKAWQSMKRAGGTNVNILPPGTEKGMAQFEQDQYQATSGAAFEAEAMMDRLNVLSGLLDSGMPTGGLEDLTLGLRGIAAQLGVANSETVGKQKLFEGLSNAMALMMKEGMTGPMSDRDIQFLQRQVPQLSNTVEGNRMMIEILQRFSRRKVELADLMEQYIAENGSLNGWRRYRSDWVRKNPINLTDLQAPF